MNRRVAISPEADRDIDAIAVYLAEQNVEVARRFLLATADTFADLTQMPGMGRFAGFQNSRLADLRQWHVKDFNKYLVFYRATDELLEVVRVIHGAQDVPTLLEEGTE